ncbi:unnamed protein product, partial [Brassica oleracea var. botrytis]
GATQGYCKRTEATSTHWYSLHVIQNRVLSGPAGKIPARISGSRRSLRPESGEEPGGWTSSEENYPLDTAKLGRNLKKS